MLLAMRTLVTSLMTGHLPLVNAIASTGKPIFSCWFLLMHLLKAIAADMLKIAILQRFIEAETQVEDTPK